MHSDQAWADPASRFIAINLPPGVIGINIEGRQITGPLQGFGQMWQKTYRVSLPGLDMTPTQVMEVWKHEFPEFQPPATRFYPPMSGIQPGQVIYINLELPIGPGLPNAIPVASGVLVLYCDDEMFTVTTPEGFPVSGWNTFSVTLEDGLVTAQIQSIDRATDPIYELGTLFMGGAARQEANWIHVLTALAGRFGIQGHVEMTRTLVDPRRQWSEAGNIWKNAAIRTLVFRVSEPFRRVRTRDNGRDRASARAQDGGRAQPSGRGHSRE